MLDKKILAGALTAIVASLCCITPVLAVLAGATGLASTFSWVEPFRPYLIAITILLLAYAWWEKLKLKKQNIECACDPDEEGKVSFWHTQTFLLLVTVFSVLMLSFPYWGDTFIKNDKPKVVVVDKANVFKTRINIEGMTCPTCEATVERIGGDVEGVISIKASTEDKFAIVEFDQTKTDINTIMKAIGNAGYKPVSYEDNSGKHAVSGIEVKADEVSTFKKDEVSKCGDGKCSTGKCGTEKRGDSK